MCLLDQIQIYEIFMKIGLSLEWKSDGMMDNENGDDGARWHEWKEATQKRNDYRTRLIIL